MATNTKQRLVVEAVGTAMLLLAIVGSGVMGERLSQGNVAVALLANSIATGCALFVLISIFAPISGAHFNPIVSLIAAVRGTISRSEMCAYFVAQIGGAFAGVAIAHVMFELPIFSVSRHVRIGTGQLLGEVVSTFGLVVIILIWQKYRQFHIALGVAAYITGAYWFTSSTSFANPAVTLARSVSDTFVGLRPIDVPGFVLAQLLGGAVAALFCHWLERDFTPEGSEVDRSKKSFDSLHR